jgi:hypothetical protein
VDESVSDERSGSARWLTVHDDLLRGLTHALSNRVGTIAAASYLLESMPDTLPTAAETLRAESERLDGQLQLLRLLPRRPQPVNEPVVPTDMTAQACALLGYHPELGDIPVTIELDGDLQPAYADPTSTILALTVAIAAVQRAVGRHGRVVVRILCDTERVHYFASGTHPRGVEVVVRDGDVRDDDVRDELVRDDELQADLAAVRWLLLSSGGDATGQAGAVAVSLPTLQAARRAQRE